MGFANPLMLAALHDPERVEKSQGSSQLDARHRTLSRPARHISSLAANLLAVGSVLGRMPFAAIADVVACRGGEHACSRAKGGRNEHPDCSPWSRCRPAAAEAWKAPAPGAAHRRLVGRRAYMGRLAPRVRIGACRAGAPALADRWRRETPRSAVTITTSGRAPTQDPCLR
jgi:hypothetical protein